PPKAIRFRYVDDRIRGLQRLARIGEDLGVDTRPVVKIGHKVYEIILDTIREEAVNLLLMSWRGDRVEGDRRVFGSNIDYLIENAPCDVIVFKTQGLRKPLKRIVVLTSPIWSLEGIDDLALILAEEDHAVVEVVSLASDPTEAERLKQESSRFEGRGQESEGLSHPIRPAHRVDHDRDREDRLHAERDAPFLQVPAGPPEGVADARLDRLEVGLGLVGQDAKRDGDGSHGRPSQSHERAGRAAVRDGLIAATRAPPNPRLATARTQEDGRPLAREDGPAGGATRL